MATPTRRRSGLKSRLAAANISLPRVLAVVTVMAIALTLAWSAALAALANAARAANPVLVERATSDPLAPLYRLQFEFTSAPNRLRDGDVRDIALASLRAVPLNTPALRVLAMHRSVAGDAAGERALATLSERVSRRDFLTQLLLIEQATRRNDIALALVHYDRALRTSRPAREMLFPILGTAIASDDIARGLMPYLRRRSEWAPAFFAAAAQNERADPRRLALLALNMSAEGQAWLTEEAGPSLFQRLIDVRAVALARRVYARTAGANPGLLDQVGFNAATTAPQIGLLAWQTLEGSRLGATFESQAGSEQRTARILAGAGEEGRALRRVLTLAPGRYVLREQRTLISGDPAARATWQMRCLAQPGGAILWQGPADRASYRTQSAPGPVIPAGCPNQMLELQVAAGTGGQDLELILNALELRRQ